MKENDGGDWLMSSKFNVRPFSLVTLPLIIITYIQSQNYDKGHNRAKF